MFILKGDFRHSSFYKHLQHEHTEIQKLKWIESEKVGYDIGYNKAVHIWIRFHKYDWVKYYKNKK